MSKFKSLAILLIFFFAFGVFSNSVRAEDQIIANCSEYYKFQSVKVNLETDKQEYIPGEAVKISGTAVNTNNYPLTDGYLYVRIAKKNIDYVTEGHNIIDEFFGVEQISIDALKDKSISFEWQIPESLSGGNFVASFFFSTGKKFDLAGLPYTNDTVAGSADFTVKTTNYQSIFFERSKTKINGQSYNHIGRQPVFGVASSTVTVTQSIRNTYKEAKTVKVKYELFFWDSMDSEQDKISSKTEEVVILKNSTKEVVYNLEKLDQTNYYLKITATSEDDKSIVNVRFGSNLERPRLNFLNLTKFPVKKGESTHIFACFSNTSILNTAGKVIIVLYDKNDIEVARLNYSGVIYADLMASKKEFLADKDYNYLRLKAEVYDAKDARVDKYEVVYDCKDLISGRCIEAEAAATAPGPIEKPDGTINAAIIVSGAVLIVLIVIIIILIKRREAAEEY